MTEHRAAVYLAALSAFAALASACGGGGGSGTIAPVPTLAPGTPIPISSPTPTLQPTVTPTLIATAPPSVVLPPATPAPAVTPSPTATPQAAFSLTWTSASLLSSAPQGGPVLLYASTQTATLTASGNNGNVSGALSNCSNGNGVSPPITLSQQTASSFIVTATNASGSCNVLVTDSTGRTASIQVINTVETITVS